MRDETRHYHLTLTDAERAALVAAGRAFGRPTVDSPRTPATDAADRLEREAGEDDVLSLATSRLRAWYYGRVRDLAGDVLRAMLDGEVSEAPPSPDAAAFCALEADVRELLETYERSGGPEGVELPEGFDLGDPETWTAGDEDEEGGAS